MAPLPPSFLSLCRWTEPSSPNAMFESLCVRVYIMCCLKASMCCWMIFHQINTDTQNDKHQMGARAVWTRCLGATMLVGVREGEG